MRPSGLTGMCPTSPANPRAPVSCWPSTIRPPPTPTSPEMKSTCWAPTAAPRRSSASAPRSASLATAIGSDVPSASARRSASGTSRQPRFGAIVTTPASRRTMPTTADADADHAVGVGQAALHGARQGREVGDGLVDRGAVARAVQADDVEDLAADARRRRRPASRRRSRAPGRCRSAGWAGRAATAGPGVPCGVPRSSVTRPARASSPMSPRIALRVSPVRVSELRTRDGAAIVQLSQDCAEIRPPDGLTALSWQFVGHREFVLLYYKTLPKHFHTDRSRCQEIDFRKLFPKLSGVQTRSHVPPEGREPRLAAEPRRSRLARTAGVATVIQLVPGPLASGPVVSQSERELAHVRHRRLRRQASRPGPAARRPHAPRVPRLRLGRHLDDRGRRDRLGARGGQPRPPARGRLGARATRTAAASPPPPARPRPASATRAGPPTGASTRRTPTRTSTPPTASTSSSTGSSRTTWSLRERLSDMGAVFTSETDAEVIAHLDRPPPGDRRSLLEAVRAAYAELEGHYAFVAMAARRARDARRRAQGVPADRRPRRGRDVPRPRHPRLPARDAPRPVHRERRDRRDHARGHDVHAARRHRARARGRRDRLGRGDRREGRLRDLHAQGDPRAGGRAWPRRSPTAPCAPTASTSTTWARSTRRCCATSSGSSSSPAARATTPASSAATRSRSGRASRWRWTSPPSTATATPSSGPGDLVIGITQSGETADTLAAMRIARERGATVLAITNIMGSQATRDADGVLYTRAGLEVGVAATKTFVCQVAVMYLLGLRARRAARHARRRAPRRARRRPQAHAALHRGAAGRVDADGRPRSPTPTGTRTSSSTSAATSGCRWRSRARSSSRRSPTSPPTPTRRAR